MSESEKKAMTIKEVRESLPVYGYRQALLDAVRDHQVSRLAPLALCVCGMLWCPVVRT